MKRTDILINNHRQFLNSPFSRIHYLFTKAKVKRSKNELILNLIQSYQEIIKCKLNNIFIHFYFYQIYLNKSYPLFDYFVFINITSI